MTDTSLIFNIFARDKTSAALGQIKNAFALGGAAIGAALMVGVQGAIEKGKLDAKLSAQLGATPAQAKEIGKLSGEVYAQGFGADMPAVSAAIKSAAENGLVSVEKISSDTSKAAVKNLLTVGDMLEEDSARVSSAVSQMLRTGLAQNAEQAMDLLVKATQNGVNKSQDLLDTMNEYGTQFRKLGLSGPHAMGLLSQAIKAGARDSDTAADAIKEFSIRAVDGSKTSIAGFKALGLNAKDMMANFGKGGDIAAESFNTVLQKLRGIEDPVKRSQVAVALFGTKAEDLGDALYAMNLDGAKQMMNGFQGATAKAGQTAITGAARLDVFKRQVQGALIEKLGQAVPYIEATFGWMQRNQAWLQPLAIGLGIIGAAIGVVTIAQWAWNAALALSPVTWIVIAVAALVAIIVLVATKTKFFQTIWQAVWGFMKGVGAWFAGPFANFFVQLWQKIVRAFNGIKSGIGTAINWVKARFTDWRNNVQQVTNWIILGVAKVLTFIRSAPGKVAGALKNMFAPLWNGFKAVINRVISGWNRLSFRIPTINVLGMKMGGGTIGVPNIPHLASGAGMVRQSGLAVIHRGESITPAARVTPYRSTSGEGGSTLTIRGDGSRTAAFLLELLREAIRDLGGDPVKVLTPR